MAGPAQRITGNDAQWHGQPPMPHQDQDQRRETSDDSGNMQDLGNGVLMLREVEWVKLGECLVPGFVHSLPTVSFVSWNVPKKRPVRSCIAFCVGSKGPV